MDRGDFQEESGSEEMNCLCSSHICGSHSCYDVATLAETTNTYTMIALYTLVEKNQ